MSRLVWGASGERFYEAGIDRGVLYVKNEPGVVWNGLISVSAAHSGADLKSYYLDGIAYYNRLTNEEFTATIEAYTYPEEFGRCDGTLSISNGLSVTQQRRKTFGLSYRSRIGNDTNGLEHGYKIHIVYNALAQPADQNHQTLGESNEAFNFSWAIATKPSMVKDFQPSAHYEIDSRDTPSGLLGYIEDILYGSDLNTPRLPDAGELAYIFDMYGNFEYDAEGPLDTSYYTIDGGDASSTQTSTVDGGTP